MIIVFEGIDGSGKGTQSKKLSEYLTNKGVNNALFSFPNYTGTFFGGEVGKYLNGTYGSMASLPAEFPAMLYAMDRFEMKGRIFDALKQGQVVIFDRYVPSNFAHQAAKLPIDKQADFINWVKKLEYGILGLPQPDKVIFLDMPPEVSRKLVIKKDARVYTSKKEDLHEKDSSYLAKVYNTYKTIAGCDGWVNISCLKDGTLLPPEEIFSDIINQISFN